MAHSLSPALHTAAGEALGLSTDYTRVDVPESEWEAFWAGAREDGGWSGFSVTMPLKPLAARDAAESDAGLVHPLLKVARLYWLAVTVVLIGIAGAFLWNGARAQDSGEPVIDPLTGMESVGVLGGATGQFTMGTAVALLAAASLWGWIGLLRRRRSAIGTLTFIAVLLAAPAFLRANGLLIILAVVMLLGAALVWLPPVRSRVRR